MQRIVAVVGVGGCWWISSRRVVAALLLDAVQMSACLSDLSC